MNTLGYGTVWNDKAAAIAHWGTGGQVSTTETAWDITRARACVCDAGYDGINCANRMCPYGNDPLFITAYQNQISEGYSNSIQTINLTSTTTLDSSDTFALKFTSRLNETFTTDAIAFTAYSSTAATNTDNQNALATSIQNALLALPNKVVDGVTVEVLRKGALTAMISVTFTGNANQGQQNLLELDTAPCAGGCNPRVSGLTDVTGTIIETDTADFNSYECGRRGKCDYDTGLCACFNGFTGDNCNTITALI